MPAGLMRAFGKSTKTQLTVLGIVLLILGAAGTFGVMFLSNETPASLVSATAKGKYYDWVAVWAILAFVFVMVAGLLVVGTALTGLPFVHMAKYHTGVFYTGLFSLLLIPAAMGMRAGSVLRANAMCDTMFADGITDQVYSSPSGTMALVVGTAIFALSVFVVLVNLLHLSKVSYRPALVKGGSVTALALVVVLISTYAVMPFLIVLQFEYGYGLQGAVGFEEFDPKDVQMTPGWVKWLAEGETSSTYGSMSFWLTLMTWFLFFAIVVTVVGFIGLALYAANDRSPNTFNMALSPMASILFVVLAIVAYLGYSGTVGQLAERLNVDSDITKITYMAGNMWVVLVLQLAALGVAGAYAMSIRSWLAMMSKGTKMADPISMNSLVDPPTELPTPPTGWPAKWDKMSTANIAVVAVAVLLVIVVFPVGIKVKAMEDTSTSFTHDSTNDLVDLDSLSDEERSFMYNDYAADGATRAVLWQPDGAWFIKSMELVVTWTDETPFFRHENLPDTFEGAINASTGEGIVGEGSSTTTTLTGELRTHIEFDKYILMTELPGIELPAAVVKGDITVNITCVEAGDQEPIGAGFLTFADDGNDFSATLIVRYKAYSGN
jgi:hypothetical protein